jgi:hypothetical protein
LVYVTGEFEDVLTLKVAVAGDTVSSREGICLVAQDFLDLAGCPDEELALFAFTVGILCRVEPARWICHLGDHVV